MSPPLLLPRADSLSREGAEYAWVRWYLNTFGDDESRVLDTWESVGDLATDEREELGGRLEDFHARSRYLPFLMAKLEAANLPYYKQLRECLYLRPVRRGRGVFLLGPTAGADVEAISSAGGSPHLVADGDSPWRTVCEERLFDAGIWFENTSSAAFRENLVNFRYVVISAWAADPNEAVRSSYNALGEHGFVFFPASRVKLSEAAAALGMRRLDKFQETVAVYFKHPGAAHVCDEI